MPTFKLRELGFESQGKMSVLVISEQGMDPDLI